MNDFRIMTNGHTFYVQRFTRAWWTLYLFRAWSYVRHEPLEPSATYNPFRWMATSFGSKETAQAEIEFIQSWDRPRYKDYYKGPFKEV